MTCHSQLWTNARMLEPLRSAWARQGAIEWIRIHRLPDYVYFDHSAHIANGVGCTSCHGDTARMIDFCFGARDNSLWRHIAISPSVENEDRSSGGHDHFVVHRIERKFVVFFEESFRTLNDANRGNVTACIAFEEENGFRKGVRNSDFVMYRIVRNGV